MNFLKYIAFATLFAFIFFNSSEGQNFNEENHQLIRKYLDNDNLEEAEKIVDSIKQNKTSRDKEIISARFYSMLGRYYRRKFILDSAIQYQKKAWETVKKIDYDKFFDDYLRTLAYYYWESGNYSQALSHILEILRNIEKVDSTRYKQIYNITGLTYLELGNYELAEKYFLKAVDASKNFQNEHYLGIIYANIGKMYLRKHELDKALQYYEKGSKIELDYKDYIAAGRSYADMAKIYIEKNQLENAYKHLVKGKTYAENASDDVGLSRINIGFGNFYKKQKEYTKARKHFQKAVNKAKAKNTQRELMEGYYGLYECNSQLGNYEEATQDLLQYLTMYKELYNFKKIIEAENLQHKLNLQEAKTKNQKEQLKKQKTINRLLYIVIALSLIAAGALLVLFIRSRKDRIKLRKKNKEIEKQKLDLEYLNQELRRAKEQAENSEALKDHFLRNISHEIRTPLNGIIGFSSIMTQPGISDAERKNYQNIVEQNAKTLISTIEDILDIAKIKSHQVTVYKEKFDVNNLIEELEKLIFFEKNFQKKEEINIVLENHTEGQQFIYSDKGKIRKILIVLANNALKFTREGQIKIGYHIQNGKITFFIEDTGIGISEEDRKKIFESFSQAEPGMDRSYQGLGLGLTIAKAFVDILNGEIKLQSEKNQGSTFYFSIPITQ
jgi:signal transduction histidine kinase